MPPCPQAQAKVLPRSLFLTFTFSFLLPSLLIPLLPLPSHPPLLFYFLRKKKTTEKAVMVLALFTLWKAKLLWRLEDTDHIFSWCRLSLLMLAWLGSGWYMGGNHPLTFSSEDAKSNLHDALDKSLLANLL